MLINEVCRKCNLTKKAIEYYGEHGLIRQAVLKNGYRNFSEADVAKLKRIAVLRGLDLSVSEIHTVLEKDSLSSMYDFFYKKELKIADLQTKQMLIKQLADGEDWDNIRKQVEALQKKQSILNRILDKFPGYYGKFVCSHFSLFLDEPITSKEQQDAFETIITFINQNEIRSSYKNTKQCPLTKKRTLRRRADNTQIKNAVIGFFLNLIRKADDVPIYPLPVLLLQFVCYSFGRFVFLLHFMSNFLLLPLVNIWEKTTDRSQFHADFKATT